MIMNFTVKIALLCMMHYLIAPSKSLNLLNSMNMSWTQVVPSFLDKSYIDPEKLFYDVLLGKNNHSLALLRWKDANEDHPTECNVTVRTHNFKRELYTKICDVEPPLKNQSEWVFADRVTLLKNDRVLISWRVQHETRGWNLKSQVIFMDTCQSSEFIVVNSRRQLIVRLKNRFEMIFNDFQGCSVQYYCKISFIHNGQSINDTPTPMIIPFVSNTESVIINKAYAMNFNSKEGIVLVGKKYETFFSFIEPDVYSPILGWSSTHGDLAYVENVYSNSSGFATFCWFSYHRQEISCKWLDGTHSYLTVKLHKAIIKLPWIHNTPNGHILLIKDGYNNGKKLFIDETYHDGKCRRIMKMSIDDVPKRVELSIRNRNKYCLSLVTQSQSHSTTGSHVFINNFITKCVKIPQVISQNHSLCGKHFGL